MRINIIVQLNSVLGIYQNECSNKIKKFIKGNRHTPSFARLTLMAFFSSSHFWINLAHSFLKCVLNLGQLFILRKKDAHANFVRRTCHNIYARISWGNSSKKRKKCNKKNIFLRLLSLEFSAKQKMETFTFDSFGCFPVRFIVIVIYNFAFLHNCLLPNKKDQILFLKAF